jgi:ABC-type nitrate/sulfonate/bicarbonate transport system substrate-binding protein
MRRSLILILGLSFLTAPLQAADEKVRLSISALDVSFLTAGIASQRGFFKDEGLDVEVIRMNANVSIPALPADSEAKKLAFNVLARTYELFTFPFTGIGATTKKLREKPDEAKRMIKAGIRANLYMRQNRDGAIQVMMDWGKTDRESAANTYDSTWRIFSEDGGMTENGLKVVIDQAKQSMNIDRPVAISEVADFSLVRDAQKELGIKAR